MVYRQLDDVEIGSSFQDISQLNDCDGTFPPVPLCLNLGFNALGLYALDDKDVSIGESLQSVEQLKIVITELSHEATLDFSLISQISYP